MSTAQEKLFLLNEVSDMPVPAGARRDRGAAVSEERDGPPAEPFRSDQLLYRRHAALTRRKRSILFPSGVKLCGQETFDQAVANHLGYFHLRGRFFPAVGFPFASSFLFRFCSTFFGVSGVELKLLSKVTSKISKRSKSLIRCKNSAHFLLNSSFQPSIVTE